MSAYGRQGGPWDGGPPGAESDYPPNTSHAPAPYPSQPGLPVAGSWHGPSYSQYPANSNYSYHAPYASGVQHYSAYGYDSSYYQQKPESTTYYGPQRTGNTRQGSLQALANARSGVFDIAKLRSIKSHSRSPSPKVDRKDRTSVKSSSHKEKGYARDSKHNRSRSKERGRNHRRKHSYSSSSRSSRSRSHSRYSSTSRSSGSRPKRRGKRRSSTSTDSSGQTPDRKKSGNKYSKSVPRKQTILPLEKIKVEKIKAEKTDVHVKIEPDSPKRKNSDSKEDMFDFERRKDTKSTSKQQSSKARVLISPKKEGEHIPATQTKEHKSKSSHNKASKIRKSVTPPRSYKQQGRSSVTPPKSYKPSDRTSVTPPKSYMRRDEKSSSPARSYKSRKSNRSSSSSSSKPSRRDSYTPKRKRRRARSSSTKSHGSHRSSSSHSATPPGKPRTNSNTRSKGKTQSKTKKDSVRSRDKAYERTTRTRQSRSRSKHSSPDSYKSRKSRSRSRNRSRSDSSTRGHFSGYDRKRYFREFNAQRKSPSKSPPKEPPVEPPPNAVETSQAEDVEYHDPPEVEGPNFAELPPPPEQIFRQALPSKAKSTQPICIKNDGSFLEMFKKMQEQTKSMEPGTSQNSLGNAKPLMKKPVLPFIGKRRGGRVLKTGMVKKVKAIDEQLVDNTPKDAWSLYMQEVKKYRETSCEEERKTRPLVK